VIGFIIYLIVIGLIAGFVARAVVPGDDSMSIPKTIVLGIVGSFVGGFLADLVTKGDDDFSPAKLVGSIIGAIIVLLVYKAVTSRSSMSRR